ncbi:MAG: sensor histidine kinase [Candidatus Cryptobacteroides sp.]
MKYVSLYIDLAFCLIFLPVMMFVFPVERWWGSHPVFFASFVMWLYVTYFLYKYYIVPNLFHGRRKRIGAIAAMIVSLVVTYLFSCYHITSPFYHQRPDNLPELPYRVWGVRLNQQAVWLHYIIVAIFCVAVGMLIEAFRQRLAREEVELERNKAELALYKAQINPHFLFNTLNTIYGLLITRSDKTEQTMERFINLTKYMYINSSKDYIPVAEEVDYISQYVELQKLRLNEFAEVRTEFAVECESFPIPPMMLITFVENAFKYGVSSNDPCFIRITLDSREDILTFTTENPVFSRGKGHSTGTGIANCRRRLDLLYPGRHILHAGENDDKVFRVELILYARNNNQISIC